MRLHDLQREHEAWRSRNFPDQQPHHALLGLAEEVGELAHAHLKREQAIRGYDDEARAVAEIEDAVGDVAIFLASYCNTNGLDLEKCVRAAWEQVRRREWAERPVTG